MVLSTGSYKLKIILIISITVYISFPKQILCSYINSSWTTLYSKDIRYTFSYTNPVPCLVVLVFLRLYTQDYTMLLQFCLGGCGLLCKHTDESLRSLARVKWSRGDNARARGDYTELNRYFLSGSCRIY